MKKVFAEIRRLFLAEIRNLNGFSGQIQVISIKKKRKDLRQNPKAFSGRNQKFKRFFRPKTADLQKKGLRRNPKAFSGRNQKFKRFFRPKTATFSFQKPALKSRLGDA